MALKEFHMFSQIYYYISIHSLRAILILCPASQVHISMLLLLTVWNKTGWHCDGLKDTFCKYWSNNSKVEMEHITDTQRHHGALIHVLSAYFPSQKAKDTQEFEITKLCACECIYIPTFELVHWFSCDLIYHAAVWHKKFALFNSYKQW